MKLRLTENPKDWRNFTGVMGLMAALITGMLWWREKAPSAAFLWTGTPALLVFLVACVKPHWFRGFYRTGRTFFHSVGEVTGRILLTVFYLLILTPLGLFLKLTGKEFFTLKRPEGVSSYWRTPKPPGSAERMF